MIITSIFKAIAGLISALFGALNVLPLPSVPTSVTTFIDTIVSNIEQGLAIVYVFVGKDLFLWIWYLLTAYIVLYSGYKIINFIWEKVTW